MKRYFVLLFAALVAVGTVASCVVVADHYLRTGRGTPPPVAQCYGTFRDHSVVIKHGVVTPGDTAGKLCDTLTITNADDTLRLMAFGQHDNHQPYDGVTEKVLSQGQSMTVTMDQLGNFTFHDHLNDAVIGYFTVVSR